MRLGYKNRYRGVAFFYSILQLPLCAKGDMEAKNKDVPAEV